MANNFAIADAGSLYAYPTMDEAVDAAKRSVGGRTTRSGYEVLVLQAVKRVKSPIPEAVVEDVK